MLYIKYKFIINIKKRKKTLKKKTKNITSK